MCSAFDALGKHEKAAVSRAIAKVKFTTEHARYALGEDIQVDAYPHRGGAIAWGISTSKGYCVTCGMVQPEGRS